jgi:hypothetical protein
MSCRAGSRPHLLRKAVHRDTMQLLRSVLTASGTAVASAGQRTSNSRLVGTNSRIPTESRPLSRIMVEKDVCPRAATLLGFVRARACAMNEIAMCLENFLAEQLVELLAAALPENERESLMRAGSTWTEERASDEAFSVIATPADTERNRIVHDGKGYSPGRARSGTSV